MQDFLSWISFCQSLWTPGDSFRAVIWRGSVQTLATPRASTEPLGSASCVVRASLQRPFQSTRPRIHQQTAGSPLYSNVWRDLSRFSPVLACMSLARAACLELGWHASDTGMISNVSRARLMADTSDTGMIRNVSRGARLTHKWHWHDQQRV